MKDDVPVCVKLPASLVRRLDAVAAARGQASRASALRDAVRRGLETIESAPPAAGDEGR